MKGERAPFLDVENPAEHRRAVESRHAQPVDVRARRHEGQHTPVADDAVVQRDGTRMGHLVGSASARRKVSVRSRPAHRKMLCSATCARRRCMRRCCSSAGIVKRRVERVGEGIGGIRIHEQRFGHLARGAGERGEDEHALSIVARGDEFLGHEIHAVVQRRYHAHIGRAIAGEDVFDAVVRARQDRSASSRRCRAWR